MTELPDEAVEAYFLGAAHGAWENDDVLVGLSDQVFIAAGGSAPRPNAALRAFLGDADQASATPPAATQRLQAGPTWQPTIGAAPEDHNDNVVPLFRRLRPAVGIAAAAAAAAVALAVTGTSGVLPEPAMRAVSWVVEGVTPFELPEPTPAQTRPERDSRPVTPSTVAPAPAVGTRPPGPGVTPEQPAGTRPVNPSASVPTSVSPAVQPPGLGVDPGRPTPTAPSNPLGSGPPAGVSPPAGGGAGPLSTTPVDRARETPAATAGPPVGVSSGRR